MQDLGYQGLIDLVTNSQLPLHSHTLRRFVRTSKGMCSRSSLRGEKEKRSEWNSGSYSEWQMLGLSMPYQRNSWEVTDSLFPSVTSVKVQAGLGLKYTLPSVA